MFLSLPPVAETFIFNHRAQICSLHQSLDSFYLLFFFMFLMTTKVDSFFF